MNTLDINIQFKSDEEAINLGIQDAQDKIGLLITNYAKTYHRYKNRTGNLTRSIGYNKLANNIIKEYIGNSAPYGGLIHEGFKKWSPDPFITNAIAANQDKIEQIITDCINKRLGI